ncbi:helix-turn-helix domain-containing protein [Natrinema salsiterrestre]|uniref:Helix-turn-helix domain-containing protein n=1 Tax=Natrinema salsiterrestre TaxID=2950540 RepID=A0A9Q4L8B8_9EURY|nr:helix-turn-helix domain-containing protein [Natrinema salsiterrestre]MDF9748392.1 helix-turn-helix domain-containing protein [Natrinema salsiterrestre]
MSDWWEVVLCGQCKNPWIVEQHDRRTQDSVSCPNCPNEVTAPRVVKKADSHEGAAELRAQYLAKEADCEEVYTDFRDEWGPWNAQLEAVEDRTAKVSDEALVEFVTADEAIAHYYDDSDSRDAHLSPDTEDYRHRYQDLADAVAEQTRLEHREMFSEQVPDERASWKIFQSRVDELLDGFADRPDPDDLPRGEITPTDQTLASVVVDLDKDATVTDIWEQLFESTRVREVLAESVRGVLAGLDPAECHEVLEDEHIPFWVRSPIINAARGDSREAWRVAVDVIPSMHEHPLAATEDLLATATLFGGTETGVALAAIVHEEWLDRKRSQREDICELLAILASNLDVRVASSGIVLQQLADRHRLDLPGVSEWGSQRRTETGIADLVNDGMAALDHDGREVAILRTLYEDDGDALSYGQLYAEFQCDESRVRQCISELVSLELVNRFGPQTGRMVELLEAGEAVLETFDKETARQRRIESFVSGDGQSRSKGRVNTHTGRVGEDGPQEPPAKAAGPWKTAFLGSAEHAGAAAAAADGGVTLVPGDVGEENDRVRRVSYDADRDEVVVAVRGADPTTYVASSAIALTWPTFLEKVFSNGRLEAIDDPPIIVREARCIGGATDDALEDQSEFIEKLADWGKEIGDMTRQLKHGEYGEFDGRDAFRSEILRKSHGLFGTMAHLLDAVGVDLVREIRVPPKADRERQLGQLARSIAVSAAIQSTYKDCFACYRQLFEGREEKRERALVPSVDAADPYGDLIGSIVIRGPDIHRLEPYLRSRLEDPEEEHEDALEIAVQVPIEDVGRQAFAETAARILGAKNLRPTSEAVSLLHGLVETPHDAAEGLHQRLQEEDERREVRPDEVRKALAGVDAAALCPDLPRSVGVILKTLLEAEEPLSKAELAERSGKCEKTVGRHEAKLEALGLLEISEDGYRVELSFPEQAERRNPVVPETVATPSFLDVVDALLDATLPPARYADPDDALGGLLWDPPNPGGILEDDDLRPWGELAIRLLDVELHDQGPTTVSMGPGPAVIQQSLPTTEDSREVGA